ncbi:TPA: hypothetical protein ACH3X2_000050 [Trebouxia sp. C0005]
MAVTGMEGFETFLFNTSVLYNLLVVYALVQALVLILMLCSFIQRWSFDPKMGPIARVLWACLPELLHVGAVLLIVALMVAITGAALFGDRAASFSTLSDSMKVLATLLVVGVMDAARADILGSGNLQLTLIETLSQEIYVFILPFILKWVVAALVVGVLVNLFSSLRKQGDHCHSSVVAQIQALLAQCWQCLFQRAPSNQNMLVTMFRLNGRGRSFKAMPSFIRYSIAHCEDAVVTLLRSTKVDTLQSPKLHPGLPSTWTRASALLKPWSRSQSPAAVHPIPTWRPTDSSSDLSGEDEDEQSPHEDLVAAAMYLLQDSTLGGEHSVPKAEQQTQKQPARDWGQFVQKHLQTQASVAGSSKLLAMRNAVPSHSARLVFASQVLTSADIRNALETAEEEYQEPAGSQHGPFPEAEEPAAEAQAVVQQWLDASAVPQANTSLPEADKARAEGQTLPDSPSPQMDLAGPEGGNHVAVLVQQYEQLGSGQAATQQAATDFTSAVWPVAQQTDRPVSGRPRLAPLQMPEGLVLHSTGPEQATAHVTSPDGSTPGASLLTLTKLQPAPSTIPGSTAITSTPGSHHQPVLQGAVARNQAAVAAHRARLHLNEHSLEASAGSAQHEGAAARHGWAVPLKTNATPATPRALATQRSSLDTGQPASHLSRLSSVTSSSEVRRSLDASLGSPSARPPLRRFGSVTTPSSLAAGSLLAPGSAPLRRGVSVATPRKTVGTLHRHSLDTGAPLPPVQGQRLSPALVRGTSVTIAEIMKQNSRLPPLDHVLPPSPVRKPLPLLRRGSSVATPAGRLTEASSKPGLHSTALKRGSSVASVLTKGSSVAAVSPSSRSINSSPERWPEPVPGWGESPGSPPLTRRSSVTFLSEIRQGVRLSPLSPRRSGSDVPLVRGVSGAVQRSPNRLLRWGSSTAAELAAAYSASAGVQLDSADLAAQHKLLRWGSSTAADLAAADAVRRQAPLSDSQSGQDLVSEDDWTGLRLAEPVWQDGSLAPAHQEVQKPAARTASRLLRWGSSTVAELAGSGSVRLDQTWPGLEMAQAVNTTPGLNSAPATTVLESTDAPANTFPDSAANAAIGGVRSGLTLRHWASSNPDALLQAYSSSHAAHGLPGRQPHDVNRHTAVGRMLAEDGNVGCAGDAPQEVAHRPFAEHASNSVQGSGHWAAGPRPGLMQQQHAEGLKTGTNDVASDSEDATTAAAAPMDSQLGRKQQRKPHKLMQRLSHQHNTKQPAHAQGSPLLPRGSSSQDEHGSQQAQVLRHRHRSRVRIDLGAHYKGIMSLGKRRSGRVSPEKAALLPVRQASGVFAQQQHVDRAASIGSAHCGSAQQSDQHPQLRTLGLVAMLLNKSKPGATVSAAVSLAPGTAKRRQQKSMQEVLHQTVQQMNVYTTWLQEQHTQQQQMKKALQVMNATSVAMLDHAISAALCEQQHRAQ